MRILQINTVCGYGSTGRIAVDIALEAESRGDECYIAYGHGTTTYHRAYQIGTYIERKCHNAFSRLTGHQALYSTRGTKLFIKWIRNLQPDIIHLHNIHGHYLNMEILFEFLKAYNHPVIWTFHDCWPFTGHCAHFDYIKCEKWKKHCESCPNLKTYPPSLFDSTYKMYDVKKTLFNGLNNITIVTPSRWLYNLVDNSFLSGYKRQVIHNGINVNLFSSVNTDDLRNALDLKNKIVLLGVSSIGFYGTKGLNYFVQLSRELDESYQIILIGISKTDKKYLPSNIIGIERTNNIGDLVRYYSMADIFINPTLEDTFPTTNLEAMSCGTPVLTFDTGGSAECLGYNTGLKVGKGKSTELLRTVKEMNSIYKRENIAFCRKRVVENFDMKQFINKYIELYNSIY